MTVPFVAPVASRLQAAWLMLAASSLIADASLCSKLAQSDRFGPPLPVLQVTQARFGFALLALLVVATVLRPKLTRRHLPLHALRTLCGGIGVTLMFAAIAVIPMSDATAISFLNPVFAMLLAIPLLGERVGPIRWTAAAIALTGALVLLRPGGGTFQPGALFALGAAAILGLEVVLIKRLSGMERVLPVLLINNGIGFLLFGSVAMTVWQVPTAPQWIVLAGVGLSMVAAQAFFINAMARADASFAIPFTYATLIFATFYDAAVFGSRPDLVSWIGAGTILGGAGLLAWREARLRAV